MGVKYAGLGLLMLLALICDYKIYRIKNAVVVPFIVAGILTNTVLGGPEGLKSSISGILLPVLLLIVFFALRMLGAGDIKLFSAVGSIMGAEFVMYAMAYSFISGGVIAVLIIALRKNGKERLRHLVAYIKSCFLSFSLLPYTDFEDKSDGAKFRFSYAIACGTLIQIIAAFYL
ncbi:prepilin peptidase CpaA [Anaerobacterium chartisolvens]|uniref:Prepilin peptidase CpaA n=1 Tax=Anaerobacterium chartisolvens TaxID=1297424 RepID=A0A369ASC7_9FIRM|nr:prepilin peptidase [Anaerobacterium chartisolvens]RCX11238.1 prepilin peptidase CpaA [Anaerobacterium chartisolvens]